MKVKEKLNDLFTNMKTKKNLLIFDFINPTILDELYIFNYGNRNLNEKSVEIEKDVLINMIVGIYGNKWDNIFTTHTNSIEELKNYNELVTETIKDDGSVNFNRNATNKISAYNVEDFVNDSSNTNIETSETNNIRVREYEIKRLKEVGHYDKIIAYLNKQNIYDMMFKDVNKLVTTLIME